MVLLVRPRSRKQAAQRLLLVLSILLPIAILIALCNGAVPLGLSEALTGLSQTFGPGKDSQAAIIIGQIRLPRILLAALIGAILAMSGAAMQGLFRNPLADPSLIGVTAGASLGASIMIVTIGYGMNGLAGLSLVSIGAFVGGLVAVLGVYRLATSSSGSSVATMLLAGIAITALAGSISNLLEFQTDNETLRRISLWKMGGLDGASYERLLVATMTATMVLIALPRYGNALNALLLGESEARHLGIDVSRVKLGLVVWVAAGVGAAVALAGTIAFVGLVVPHITRMLIGPDHRYLLPASALTGAILLVLADTLARVVMAPTELPVGVITAILGVPFFISLLRRRHQYGMQS
ncbi:MAG: iron ABC transporter permease [Halieaceae bacterium]|jgi:iron complex transport system permease protein|nr:iron ABC transporter permease [Halieaceae bacterium]